MQEKAIRACYLLLMNAIYSSYAHCQGKEVAI